MDKNSIHKIGNVFTPIKWAQFAIRKYGLFEKWIQGASILDPTMGEGNLLIALVETGLESGYQISELPVENLFGIEINAEIFQVALVKLTNICGNNLKKENFVNDDALFFNFRRKFDLVFGNPPWAYFSSLPPAYREKLKSLFLSSGLAKPGLRMLLGNSQINIAALIVFRMITEFMKDQAEAVVFMPLTVLFHAGAHTSFTENKAGDIDFCISEVRDLAMTDAFPKISTRFGILKLTKGIPQQYPVPYYKYIQTDQNWKKCDMVRLFGSTGPLLVTQPNADISEFRKIPIPAQSCPRQGVNTCGANHIFFFDHCEPADNEMVQVRNSFGQFMLPEKFIYPLIHRKNFTEDKQNALKYVLLPYHSNGKIVLKHELKVYPGLSEYLIVHQKILSERKGVYIRKNIEQGNFWALIGVGPYNFFPHKIVWQACGKKRFEPVVFSGKWQVNQALQTYLPFRDMKTCMKTFNKLKRSGVNEILESMQLGGTMCFGQAGVMSHFFEYE